MKTIKRYESMDFPKPRKARSKRNKAEMTRAVNDVLAKIKAGEVTNTVEATRALGWSTSGGLYHSPNGNKIVRALRKRGAVMVNKKKTKTAKKRSLLWHLKAWWKKESV